MSERFDSLISGALHELYTEEGTSALPAPGATAARATAKHRRRVRLTVLCALGTLAIAVPIGAIAARPHGNNGPPVIADTPSMTPTVPSPTPAAQPPVVVGNDGVTRDELLAAKLTLPAWPEACPTTDARLRGTKTDEVGTIVLQQMVDTNLDDDPAPETAALLHCQVREAGDWQVVGFQKDAAGKIVTLGRITRSGDNPEILVAILARPSAGVVVTVGQGAGSTGANRFQLREYAWQSGRFAQVAGPTAFKGFGITTDELFAAKLNLPAWGWNGSGCQTKNVQLIDTDDNGPVTLERVIDTNLDDDPQLETAILISCDAKQNTQRSYQIVALEHGPSGQIRVLGQIVANTTEYKAIGRVYPHPGGGVIAELGTEPGFAPNFGIQNGKDSVHAFGWDGTKFTEL